jgi:hypothetical protein
MRFNPFAFNTTPAAGAATPSIVTTNLQFHYDFGNSSCYPGSGTTVTDLISSTNGAIGNSTGGSTSYSSSNGGYIAWTNSYVNTNILWSNIATNNGALTIEIWYRRAYFGSPSGFQNFIIGGTAGDPNVATYTNSGSDNDILWSGVGQGSVYFTATQSYFPINAWHQLTISAPASGTATLYADGASTSKTASYRNFYSASATARAPGRTFDSNSWTGDVAIIRFYRAQLTASEILQNWNAQKTRFGY